jgi:hypothetical protein
MLLIKAESAYQLRNSGQRIHLSSSSALRVDLLEHREQHTRLI